MSFKPSFGRFRFGIDGGMAALTRMRESRNIGAGHQLDAQLAAVPFVDIIGGEPFAQFRGRCAYDVIDVGVVIGVSFEDLDPDGALLDLIGRSVQRLFHHIFEKSDGAFAGTKAVVAYQQVELRTNHARGQVGRCSVLDFCVDHALSSDSDFSTRRARFGGSPEACQSAHSVCVLTRTRPAL